MCFLIMSQHEILDVSMPHSSFSMAHNVISMFTHKTLFWSSAIMKSWQFLEQNIAPLLLAPCKSPLWFFLKFTAPQFEQKYLVCYMKWLPFLVWGLQHSLCVLILWLPSHSKHLPLGHDSAVRLHLHALSLLLHFLYFLKKKWTSHSFACLIFREVTRSRRFIRSSVT